jgi:prevent-host-death family protein
MATEFEDHASIAVTDFKAHCLSVIDNVATGKTGPVVLTKRNRPIAAIVPIDPNPMDLWGAMRGSVTVAPGTDLTEPTGEFWGAEA